MEVVAEVNEKEDCVDAYMEALGDDEIATDSEDLPTDNTLLSADMIKQPFKDLPSDKKKTLRGVLSLIAKNIEAQNKSKNEKLTKKLEKNCRKKLVYANQLIRS